MAAILLLSTLLSLSTITLSLSKISTISLDIDHFIIDCGASESDVGKGVMEEKFFVEGGKALTISGSWEDKTIRSFPSKYPINCYKNIPATRGGKTLVRTVFNYANHDKKSSPPSFFVLYDRKHYEMVVFPPPDDDDQSQFKSEVIFTPASKEISVCLIRTSLSDDPFISSIQVYRMKDGMYDDLKRDEGFILIHRIAYGAKEYTSDSYGRVWYPSPSGSTNLIISELETSAESIKITASNKPPEIVMSKALSADGFVLLNKTLSSLAGITVYLALYFSEPQNLEGAHKRTFNVFLDKNQLGPGPIVPIFGEATQVVIKETLHDSSQLIFQSTNSDLPPIINALELYFVNDGKEIDWNDIFGQTVNHKDPESEKEKYKKLAVEGAAKTLEAARKINDFIEKRNLRDVVRGSAGNTKLQNIRIIAVGVAVPTVTLLTVCTAIFIKRSKKANPQSSTAPAAMSEEAGESSLAGKKLASNASQPGQDKPACV